MRECVLLHVCVRSNDLVVVAHLRRIRGTLKSHSILHVTQSQTYQCQRVSLNTAQDTALAHLPLATHQLLKVTACNWQCAKNAASTLQIHTLNTYFEYTL